MHTVVFPTNALLLAALLAQAKDMTSTNKEGAMARGNLILGRYRPLGEAGSGGFGTVQVAWDQRIQRKVAIKTIPLSDIDAHRAHLPGADATEAGHTLRMDDTADRWHGVQPWSEYLQDEETGYAPAAAADPNATVSLMSRSDQNQQQTAQLHALAHVPGLDEARTAAMLQDPRIVTVYDFEVQGNTAYLIMEYIEGITLTRLLSQYADYLTLDIVAAVFDAVAGALQVAHSRNVLHLDIKPDNIIITPEGQVKVTDFGLATLLDASGYGTTGGGTIGYMPLEQMRRENLDVRCDEWALASTTYEMLVGENPFIVDSLDKAEAAIENAELVLPSLCWDNLDEQIDDVIFYALDPDRNARYASVKDFAEEARKFLGDPVEGKAQLAIIVSDAVGIDRENEEGREQDVYDDDDEVVNDTITVSRKPMSERISSKVVSVLSHVGGALMSGFVAYIAALNIPLVNSFGVSVTYLIWGIALAALICGAIKPHAGALVAFVLLSLALILGKGLIVGIVMLAATVVWWLFCARKKAANANTALSMPVFGAVEFNVFVPLVAGASLRPAQATVTTLFASMWALVMASFGSGNLLGWNALAYWSFASIDVQTRLIALVMQPATWCMVASWLLAALVESALWTKHKSGLAVLGVILASVLLLAGALGAAWFDSGRISYMPSTQLIVSLVLAIVLMLVVTFVFKPYETRE